MSITYLPQTSSSVMSINAITSPCYTSTKSRQSSISSSSSSSSSKSLLPSVKDISASPSFSSFTSSDPENDSMSRQWLLFDHSRVQTNSTIFTEDNFDFFEQQKNVFSDDLNYIYNNKNKSNRKGDALAVRRARNKLASAKYRAKKQALSHAMQDRIMQLATQVMALREELDQTKKSEMETKLKYDRLLQYHNTRMVNENASIL